MLHTALRLRLPWKSIRRASEKRRDRTRRKTRRLTMECLDSRQLLAAAVDEVPVWDEPNQELAPAAEIAWGASCPAILAPATIAEHEARLETILEAAFADAGAAVDGDAEAAFAELAPDVDEYSLLEGDFNGDGLTDLLFVSQNPEQTSLVLDLRLANADGRWTFAQQVISGVGEVDLQLLLVDDLNADGRDEVILALSDPQNGGALRLYVVHSLGDGNWEPMQPVSEADYVLEPAASTPAGDAAPTATTAHAWSCWTPETW